MKVRRRIFVAAALVLAGCAPSRGPRLARTVVPPTDPFALTPAKAVEEGRLFAGRWYEIARTRRKGRPPCLADTVDFSRSSDGEIREVDACRLGVPNGAVRLNDASVAFINPGLNTKIVVRSQVMGAFYVPRTYWILDHGVEYGWYMLWDPKARTLSIFTRTPHPTPRQRDVLLAKAQALGYGADLLTFDAPLDPAPPGAPGG